MERCKGWGTGGYHEIILRDGSVQLCYDPIEITNGVANHNTNIYHICVVGNGSFTPAQEKAWDERCRIALKRFGLPVSAVKGHNEFSGTSTACPGINMNTVRKALSQGQPVQVSSKVENRDYFLNGDTDPRIKNIQADLVKAGYKLVVDGIFGDGTEEVVEAFQRANNLDPDGVWGKASQATLNAILDKQNKKPPATVATPKPEEAEELELTKRQREEIAATFQKARERDVFSSAAHEKAILDGSMTQSELLYLNNLIAGAALIGGERIK
ncbi:peptidoglycan recognition protein family protein [Planococcus faecalis]|uniref:peptidoglycan recognition protein family protein n=1 Tax=Planococcus faecalis TaxID=1598147 RepID=UPI001C42F436|nr:N-acetylmuramoyl-L-alanine amidase [Planococcus faecalis]